MRIAKLYVYYLALILPVCFLLSLTGCGSDSASQQKVRVTIETTPESGASVTFAQKPGGESPVVIAEVAPGPYDVFVEKDLYNSAFKRILVEPDSPEQTFTLDMEPRVGTLSIETKPSGVEVFIDEASESIGKTPIVDHPLLIGSHKYTLKYPNYYDVSAELEVEESYKYTKKHELKPKEASLEVASSPSGASVYINNQIQDSTTPLKLELKPGTYLVSIRAEGYIEQDKRVELGAAAAERVEVKLEKGIVPPGMVLVPAGEFTMGASDRAPDEAPERKIFVDSFYIDKFEVTNQDFAVVFPSHTYTQGMELYPVTGVSWEQAVDYAKAIGKRLPTEEEWEKAARGTDKRQFPWGEVFVEEYCNSAGSKEDAPVSVDSYLEGASPYGCINMSGNVYEWVQDWYKAYPGNTQVTKDYGQVFRVLRGGSYLTERFEARSARRHFDRMDARNPDYGFRCAQDVVKK